MHEISTQLSTFQDFSQNYIFPGLFRSCKCWSWLNQVFCINRSAMYRAQDGLWASSRNILVAQPWGRAVTIEFPTSYPGSSRYHYVSEMSLGTRLQISHPEMLFYDWRLAYVLSTSPPHGKYFNHRQSPCGKYSIATNPLVSDRSPPVPLWSPIPCGKRSITTSALVNVAIVNCVKQRAF